MVSVQKDAARVGGGITLGGWLLDSFHIPTFRHYYFTTFDYEMADFKVSSQLFDSRLHQIHSVPARDSHSHGRPGIGQTVDVVHFKSNPLLAFQP